MKNRLISLNQKCTDNIQALEDCIKTRLQFLFEYVGIKSAKTYDFRDIDIKFTANVPTDDLMIAQTLAQYPKISNKTALQQFSFISDVDSEMKQIEEENKENSIGASLLNGGVK
jgi:SPP1 family phage portal protein